MIVAADNLLATGDVGMAEERSDDVCMRLWVPGWGWGLVSLPGRSQCALGATVMQEVHVDIDNTTALIGNRQPTAPVEGAHRGGFDFLGGTHGQ